MPDLALKHQPGHRQAHCRAHRRRIHGGAEGKERQIHKQRLQGEDQLSYSYGGRRFGTEPGGGQLGASTRRDGRGQQTTPQEGQATLLVPSLQELAYQGAGWRHLVPRAARA